MLNKSEYIDPLAEDKHIKTKGLIHKYSSRVLITLTARCAAYCDYCFRKRRAEDIKANDLNDYDLENIYNYIEKQVLVDEVIYSGGDPLIAMSQLLASIKKVAKLEHIKIIRIHTRVPIVAPIKITNDFLKLPDSVEQPIYLALHISYSDELKPEVIDYIKKLRQAGFILLSQTVFLKDINDNVTVLKKLFHNLVALGIKPYYIHHCDLAQGNAKYLVPIEDEIAIMTQLRQEVSGLAYPIHVIDTPQGVGKIPITTNHWEFNQKQFRDFNNDICTTGKK